MFGKRATTTNRRPAIIEPVPDRVRPVTANRRAQAAHRDDARAPATRVRALIWPVFVTTLAITVSAMLAWGVAETLQTARESPLFAIDAIEVEGNTRLTDDLIIGLSGVSRGMNLIALDIPRVVNGVLRSPWLASVRVRRVLPNALRIAVVEYEAAGAVLFESIYLFDKQGVVFKPLEADDTLTGPIVTGISGDAYSSDDRRAEVQAQLIDALALLDDYTFAGLDRRLPLSEIGVADPATYTLIGRIGGTVVTVPRLDREAGFKRLARLFDELEAKNQSAETIHVGSGRSANRLVVRLKKPETPFGIALAQPATATALTAPSGSAQALPAHSAGKPANAASTSIRSASEPRSAPAQGDSDGTQR